VSATGLSALYDALAHAAARHGLDGLGVAVDDPVLGHQAFAAGRSARAALTALGDDQQLAWVAVPARADPLPEVEALRSLALTSLRLGRVEPAADPASALEILVRGLPQVTCVLRLGAIVEVDVARGEREAFVAHLAALDLPGTGAVVLRDAASDRTSPPLAGRAALVAVRTSPETGEVEVHLRAGDQRTIGRGPLTGAGHAAATATLDALTALGLAPRQSAGWHVGWVRTVDTTPDREFLVAVMVRHDPDRSLYGIAVGASPVEAAARATLHACNRTFGWSPSQ